MRVIDLSLGICKGMMKYPSDPEPEARITSAWIEETREEAYGEGENTPLFVGVGEKYHSGYTELRLRNHHGTHIDSPAHKIPGGKTISDYPADKFVNDAVLIDLIPAGVLARQKREISLDDLKRACNRSPKRIGALIFYTGFCYEAIIRNLEAQKKAEIEKRFPYFSQDAARYIAENFDGLNIAGIDSFAFDRKGSNSEVHRILFEKDILPLETLVNLGELKEVVGSRVFTLHSMPIPILNADAAWTPAYAVVENNLINKSQWR